MNILFVCSRNKWRSRTAEHIFKNRGHDVVRSAGTAKNAEVKVSEQLVVWADILFVMEDVHKSRLLQNYGEVLASKEIIVLHIPDEYKFMDPELIEILKLSVEPYLEVE